ncbi:MAG: hypothetical protein U0R52_11895 [Solirubrobacterales bacterium]
MGSAQPAQSWEQPDEQLLVEQLGQLIAEAGDLDEAWILELIGAHLAARLEQEPEVSEAFACALARRGDAAAAALLKATAAFASGQSRGRLEEAIAAAGGPGGLPAGFGGLQARRVLHARSEVADSYLVELSRPRPSESVQLADLVILRLDQGPRGGPLLGGSLSQPLPAGEVEAAIESFLAGQGRDSGAGEGSEHLVADEIGPGELAEALDRAVAENRRQQWEMPFETGSSVPVLALALRGAADAFGWIPIAEPDPGIDVAPGDEEGFERATELLLDDFLAYVESEGLIEGPAGRSGHLVAGSMLEWKWRYGDGVPTEWSAEDLGEVLLQHFPASVMTNRNIEADALECVGVFLGFLEARGALSGDPLGELLNRCEELEADFAQACADRSLWGPGKALLMQMQAEGVDPSDRDAISAWIEDYNSRTFEERDRIVGPSLSPPGTPSRGGPPPAPRGQGWDAEAKGKRARRAKRKAARTARRRGRAR